MMTFDPSNYDAMMTYMKTVFDMADDRIIGTTGYTNKEAADAGIEQARPAMARLAEFMTTPPVVREGEIIWSDDAEDSSLAPRYVRHLVYGFDTSRCDALVSFWDTITEIYRDVSGLIRVRLARCLEPNNRMFQTVVYDSETQRTQA